MPPCIPQLRGPALVFCQGAPLRVRTLKSPLSAACLAFCCAQLRLYNLSGLFGGLCDGTCDSLHDVGERGGGNADLLVCAQRLPSKVSCMAWAPHVDGVITVGDYDGVLLQLHVASGHQLADVDHHAGRKIWSVAHSSRVPHLAASAGDDGAARLWAGRGLATCAATLRPSAKASVCSVDFSTTHDHLVALASSDRSAYVYDMRALSSPLAVLRHHARPVSYVRFFDHGRLVTASTDGSIGLWDLNQPEAPFGAAAASGLPDGPLPVWPSQQPAAAARQLATPFQQQVQARPARSGGSASSGCSGLAGGGDAGDAPPWRVFRGHRNEKNFVGLTVRPQDGLIACGSETNRAYAYYTSWTTPLASADALQGCACRLCQAPVGRAAALGAGAGGPVSNGTNGAGGGFVSAVCWQPAAAGASLGLPPMLATATSHGGVSLKALMLA